MTQPRVYHVPLTPWAGSLVTGLHCVPIASGLDPGDSCHVQERFPHTPSPFFQHMQPNSLPSLGGTLLRKAEAIQQAH